MRKKEVYVYESDSLTKPIEKGAEKKHNAEQARKLIHELVDAIPAKDLARFVGAQISVIA